MHAALAAARTATLLILSFLGPTREILSPSTNQGKPPAPYVTLFLTTPIGGRGGSGLGVEQRRLIGCCTCQCRISLITSNRGKAGTQRAEYFTGAQP